MPQIGEMTRNLGLADGECLMQVADTQSGSIQQQHEAAQAGVVCEAFEKLASL